VIVKKKKILHEQESEDYFHESSEEELYNKVTNQECTSVSSEDEDCSQEQWNQVAAFLEQQKLKLLDTKKFPTSIKPQKNLTLPIFQDGEKIKEIIILKRFSSRKLPHLVCFVNENDEKVNYIFKEEDDISMDVAVLELLKLANDIWKARKCPARLRTYTVVATPNNTGFCECMKGDTMLVVTNEDMLKQLGKNPEQWENFYYSIVGIMVATAAFDITDRHDANALFTPDGDIALIDLSASMGQKAPLDLVLGMNPIYFPLRLKKIHREYRKLSGDEPISKKLGWKFWNELEEDAMVAYYSLYNNYSLLGVLKTCGYSMPRPISFLKKMNQRKHRNVQRKEQLRNGIVQSMEDSDKVSKFVAKVCHVLPGN